RNGRKRFFEFRRILEDERPAPGEHGELREKRRTLLTDSDWINQRVAAAGPRDHFSLGRGAVPIVPVGKEHQRLAARLALETIERGDNRVAQRGGAPRIQRGNRARLVGAIGRERRDDIRGVADGPDLTAILRTQL